MSEHSPLPEGAQIFNYAEGKKNLIEKRNSEVYNGLQNLTKRMSAARTMLSTDFFVLTSYEVRPPLKDPHFAGNVIDIAIVRSNKEITQERGGNAVDKQEMLSAIHGLIVRVKEELSVLCDVELKSILKVSRVFSEAEIATNSDSPDAEHRMFKDRDLSKKAIDISLKLFLPEIEADLKDADLRINRLSTLMAYNTPDSQELKSELIQLRNFLQNIFKYIKYYLESFEKNNPSA